MFNSNLCFPSIGAVGSTAIYVSQVEALHVQQQFMFPKYWRCRFNSNLCFPSRGAVCSTAIYVSHVEAL